jgi:tRNA pseudouridine(38-40) synthase
VALLKLTLEYDGGAFRGWARQPGQRTVEGVLREALDAIYPRGWDGLAVAGRTDTGVHATGQVASVEVTGGAPAARAAEALNTALPPDVSVLRAEDASAGFNARFSATGRSYRYLVLNRVARSALEAKRSLWWPRPVDLHRLQACAALLPGEHEFTAFTPVESQHECSFGSSARRRGAPRGPPPLHDHRRLVPAAHGAHARRHDAAGPAGTPRASARRQAAGRGRGDCASVGLYLERVEYGDGDGSRTRAPG